jgi:hypothetical protein
LIQINPSFIQIIRSSRVIVIIFVLLVVYNKYQLLLKKPRTMIQSPVNEKVSNNESDKIDEAVNFNNSIEDSCKYNRRETLN